MTKEELLALYTRDVPDVYKAEITNPMNTKHSAMFEMYGKGFNAGRLRINDKPPTKRKPAIPKELVDLHSKITRCLKTSKHVWIYYSDYRNEHIYYVRSKASKSLMHDYYTKFLGSYTSRDDAVKAFDKLYNSHLAVSQHAENKRKK